MTKYPKNKALCARLKDKRKELRLTQQEVAGALDLSKDAYAKMEQGVNSIRREYIPKLAECLQLDEQELMEMYLGETRIETENDETAEDQEAGCGEITPFALSRWNRFMAGIISTDGDVIIPETFCYDGRQYRITAIAPETFFYCEDMKSVTIPDSVTKIGGCAFQACHALEKAILPASLESIGEWAFAGCSSLKHISIPDSVIRIETYAFGACDSLQDITLPGSLSQIGEHIFGNCSSLETAVVSGGIKRIAEGMFCNCTSLKKAVLPDGLLTIGKGAFANCYHLADAHIPDSVTDIQEEAFQCCRLLADMPLPEGACVHPDAFTMTADPYDPGHSKDESASGPENAGPATEPDDGDYYYPRVEAAPEDIQKFLVSFAGRTEQELLAEIFRSFLCDIYAPFDVPFAQLREIMGNCTYGPYMESFPCFSRMMVTPWSRDAGIPVLSKYCWSYDGMERSVLSDPKRKKLKTCMDVVMYNIEVLIANKIEDQSRRERLSQKDWPKNRGKCRREEITHDPYILQLWRIYKTGDHNLFCCENQKEKMPLMRSQKAIKVKCQPMPSFEQKLTKLLTPRPSTTENTLHYEMAFDSFRHMYDGFPVYSNEIGDQRMLPDDEPWDVQEIS